MIKAIRYTGNYDKVKLFCSKVEKSTDTNRFISLSRPPLSILKINMRDWLLFSPSNKYSVMTNSEYIRLVEVLGKKRCPKCYVLKELSCFNLKNKGSTTYCTDCTNIINRSNLYGITQEEYLNMPKECAICCTNQNLVIDHDHSTDKFRGILCRNCNLGLGFFKDNIEYLQKAILYIGNSN